MDSSYKNLFSIILYTILAIIGSNGIAFLLLFLTDSYTSTKVPFFASCIAIPFGILYYFFFEDKKPAWIILLAGLFNIIFWLYTISWMWI